MRREERAYGVINVSLLLLFLAGALMFLLWEGALSERIPLSEKTPLYAMALVLCMDLLLCLSPLALLLQPPTMLVLGAASADLLRSVLTVSGSQRLDRLLLLLLSVPLSFLLGGRGLRNALLLCRVLRKEREGLGIPFSLCFVLVLFGAVSLWLLCRILRFE